METLVGFAFGFWLGTKQGKEGVSRLLESIAAIREEAEVKRLVGEAVGALIPIVREVAAVASKAA